MTPQATNRREGGLTSCRGRTVVGSSAPSLKELRTVRAAQKLLRAPTIGMGSARAGGWWWRELIKGG